MVRKVWLSVKVAFPPDCIRTAGLGLVLCGWLPINGRCLEKRSGGCAPDEWRESSASVPVNQQPYAVGLALDPGADH